MAEIHGTCEPRFAELRDVLSDSIDSGADLGASVAVFHDDEPVVDVWGGWADEARTRPWEEHTVTNVWSTTKTVVALAALLLVERGQLDVFAPVADYWPEFAQNGKERIEVRHLLSHTSGVSGWDQPVTVDDIYDWERATAILAAQPPWWEPGTASGYHLVNYGHLVGEVIRRVDGRSLRRFVAEELAAPFDADFQIGLQPEDEARVSDVVTGPFGDFPSLEGVDPTLVPVRTFTGPVLPVDVVNSAEWRAAELGGVNGHSNARGVARLQRVIGNDGVVDGRRVLSPETLDLIWQEQAAGPDQVLFLPLRWGIGFALPQPDTFPYVPAGRVCLWGGAGGSLVVMDRDRHLTIAYMMNLMELTIIGGPRAAAIVSAVYRALD